MKTICENNFNNLLDLFKNIKFTDQKKTMNYFVK